MGTVVSYITDLVHLHDCVIVPGLGAFVGNYKPSEINQEKGLFLPPKKEIGFNRSLQHNDGLLCDYIARCEDLTFNAAFKKVEAFVLDTVSALSNKQIVPIGDIGELKKDAVGNILFWPNGSALLLPESFGLAPFHFVQAHHSAQQQLNHRKIEPSTQWLRRISQRQWVAGIALFVGLFLLSSELQTPYTVNSSSLVPSIATTENETAHEAEPIADEALTTIADHHNTAAGISDASTSEMAINDAPIISPSYYLVAASFPSISAANHHKELMVKSGYSECEILSVDGKNRVTLEKFASRSEAISALANYRQIKGFESVWLLKN